MVGDQQQPRAPFLRQQPVGAEQLVDVAEVGLGHAAVARDVGRVDAGQRRRRVAREGVADAVGPLQVEDGEVGLDLRQRIAEQGVVGSGLDEDPPQRADGMGVRVANGGGAPQLRLVEPRQVLAQRHEVGRRLRRVEPLLRPRQPLRRRHGSGKRLVGMEEREEAVRHHQAVHRLGGVRRPQPEHDDLAPRARRHVPHRRRAALRAGDRLGDAVPRPPAREVEDAVLEGRDPGHHRRPQQRRQRRLLRREHSAAALAHQPLQLRHRARREQPVEVLPVRAVEPDHPHGRAPRRARRRVAARPRPQRQHDDAGAGRDGGGGGEGAVADEHARMIARRILPLGVSRPRPARR